MPIETVKPFRQVDLGYHDCGEAWGFMGHTHFEADYICPHCWECIHMTQCAAWSSTMLDCPHCGGGSLDLQLRDVEGVAFR